jgi:hypothetical protein
MLTWAPDRRARRICSSRGTRRGRRTPRTRWRIPTPANCTYNPANLIHIVRPAPVRICIICGTLPRRRPCTAYAQKRRRNWLPSHSLPWDSAVWSGATAKCAAPSAQVTPGACAAFWPSVAGSGIAAINAYLAAQPPAVSPASPAQPQPSSTAARHTRSWGSTSRWKTCAVPAAWPRASGRTIYPWSGRASTDGQNSAYPPYAWRICRHHSSVRRRCSTPTPT